jgi:hypothetical protein
MGKVIKHKKQPIFSFDWYKRLERGGKLKEDTRQERLRKIIRRMYKYHGMSDWQLWEVLHCFNSVVGIAVRDRVYRDLGIDATTFWPKPRIIIG